MVMMMMTTAMITMTMIMMMMMTTMITMVMMMTMMATMMTMTRHSSCVAAAACWVDHGGNG
eukprot:2491486-Lingulodinium_polyedra.AAC.1